METLAQLMNLAIIEKYVPSEWWKSFVVPLYKSGDPEVADNYKGITLGICVSKVFTRVLTRRLGEYAEERILTEHKVDFELLRPNTEGGLQAKKKEEKRNIPGLS